MTNETKLKLLEILYESSLREGWSEEEIDKKFFEFCNNTKTKKDKFNQIFVAVVIIVLVITGWILSN